MKEFYKILFTISGVIAVNLLLPHFSTVLADNLPVQKDAQKTASLPVSSAKNLSGDDPASAANTAPAPSSSMASLAVNGVGVDVNPQTGQCDLKMSLYARSGISEDMAISVNIIKSSSSNSILNMTPGWKYDIDYIDLSDTTNGRLYTGSGSYVIAPNFKSRDGYQSGLLYVTNKSIKFEKMNSTVPLSYDSSRSYLYLLSSQKGSNEYFDSYGKLICRDDRFGNHVLYNYSDAIHTGTSASVYNVRLQNITDSYGYNVTFSDNGSVPGYSFTVTSPDINISTSADFSQKPGKITFTENMGSLNFPTNISMDSSGNILEVDYPNGGIVKYEYKPLMPYQTRTSQGRFNAVSKVTAYDSIQSSPSRSTVYSYSSGTNFTGYALPNCYYDAGSDSLMESGANSYSYTSTVTAPSGISETTSYNFLHLPVAKTQHDRSGNLLSTTAISYNANNYFPSFNNLTSNYNLPSSVTTTVYSGSSSSSNRIDTTYDDYGKVLSVTSCNNNSPINSQTNTYDDSNYGLLLTSTFEDKIDGTTVTTTNTPSSDGKYIASSSDGTRTTSTELDSCGRVTSTTLSYESGSSKTTISYGINSDALTMTSKDASGNTSASQYDLKRGLSLGTTLNGKYSTSISYDDYSTLVATVTNQDGSTVTYNSSELNVSKVSYSNTHVSTSYANGFGEVYLTMDNQSPNSDGKVTSYTYNESGKAASATDEIFNHTEYYTYNDPFGRLTSVKDYLGNYTNTVYNDADIYNSLTVKSVTKYIFCKSTDPLSGVKASESFYDDQGALLCQTDYLSGKPGSSANVINTAAYNGRKQMIYSDVSVDTGKHTWANYTYDVSGYLTEKDIFTADGTNAQIKYTRGLFGNILYSNTSYTTYSPGVDNSIKEIKSDVCAYDNIGRLKTRTNQLGQSTSYTYGDNGEISKTVSDFTGITNYTYDPTGTQLKNISGDDLNLAMNYNSPADQNLKAGAITSKLLTSPADTVSYTYYDNGLLESKTDSGKEMDITYDQYYRVASSSDYAGNVTSFTYDSLIPSKVTNISNNLGSASFSYYDSSSDPLFGNLTTVKEVDYSDASGKPNGKIVYNYYTNSNASQAKAPLLSSVETYNSDNKLICASEYEYDDLLRTSSITQKNYLKLVASNKKTYTYNDLGELTNEKVTDLSGKTTLYSCAYTYDIKGNILSKAETQGSSSKYYSYIYDEDNKLTQIAINENGTGTAKTLGYDSRGNLADIKENNTTLKSYTFNGQNQLTTYTANGLTYKYTYNADGLRKSKTDDSNTIYFYYTGDTIVNEADNNNAISSYLFAPGRMFRSVNGKTQMLIKNAKDVVGTTSDGKAMVDTYDYTSYGKQEDFNNDQPSTINDQLSLSENPFRYSSYYTDSESGMNYLNARYYDPELMCFISRDSYDLSNRYNYADGNPVSNIDPGGHMSKSLMRDLDIGLNVLGLVASVVAIPASGGSSLAIASLCFAAISTGTDIAQYAVHSKKLSTQLGYVSAASGVLAMGTGFAAGAGKGAADVLSEEQEQQIIRRLIPAAAPNEELDLSATHAKMLLATRIVKGEQLMSREDKAIMDWTERYASQQGLMMDSEEGQQFLGEIIHHIQREWFITPNDIGTMAVKPLALDDIHQTMSIQVNRSVVPRVPFDPSQTSIRQVLRFISKVHNDRWQYLQTIKSQLLGESDLQFPSGFTTYQSSTNKYNIKGDYFSSTAPDLRAPDDPYAGFIRRFNEIGF